MINSTLVSLINYDVSQRIGSPSTRSIGDSNRLGWGFLTTWHMQVPVPNVHISTFTRILQNVNGFVLPDSTVLHHLRHSLMDSQDVYTLLSPFIYSQCAIVLSRNGIAEVLGLPEYVASTTKSQPQDGLRRYGPQSTQARHYIKTQFMTQAKSPLGLILNS
jgi:hypothetical protein